SAEDLYRRPTDRFVAGFIGRGTLVPAAALGLPGDGDVLLRPDRLRHDPAGTLRAVLLEAGFRGPDHVARLRLEGGEVVEADLPADAVQSPGTTLTLRLVEEALVVLPRQEDAP